MFQPNTEKIKKINFIRKNDWRRILRKIQPNSQEALDLTIYTFLFFFLTNKKIKVLYVESSRNSKAACWIMSEMKRMGSNDWMTDINMSRHTIRILIPDFISLLSHSYFPTPQKFHILHFSNFQLIPPGNPRHNRSGGSPPEYYKFRMGEKIKGKKISKISRLGDPGRKSTSGTSNTSYLRWIPQILFSS